MKSKKFEEVSCEHEIMLSQSTGTYFCTKCGNLFPSKSKDKKVKVRITYWMSTMEMERCDKCGSEVPSMKIFVDPLDCTKKGRVCASCFKERESERLKIFFDRGEKDETFSGRPSYKMRKGWM